MEEDVCTASFDEAAGLPELLGIEQVSDGWIKKYILTYRLPKMCIRDRGKTSNDMPNAAAAASTAMIATKAIRRARLPALFFFWPSA